MKKSTELASAEAALTTARNSFNSARQSLAATLSNYAAREGASDRLIHHADEYGVDHTVSVLTKTPHLLDLEIAIPRTALFTIRTKLKYAYEAMHHADLAMANRENLALKADPKRGKAILIGDREVIFNLATDTLTDRSTGEVMKADATFIETEDNGNRGKREKERDR